MDKSQKILWTILPHGMTENGLLRFSVVVSPRLTPDSTERLSTFPEFVDWPDTLKDMTFSMEIQGNNTPIPLELISQPDSDSWKKIFDEKTPVAGFKYNDMSQKMLHSFSVRNMLSYLKRNYGKMAVSSATDHPVLLPADGKQPNDDLLGMLQEAGTPITYNGDDRYVEIRRKNSGQDPSDAWGINRFFGSAFENKLEKAVQEYSRHLVSPGWVPSGHAMPPDWRPEGPGQDPVSECFSTADEYNLYQADRFYRRTRPTREQLAMRHPSYENIPPAPKEPKYDFHRMVAALASYPELMRRLGLVLDFAITDDTWLQKNAVGEIVPAEGTLRLYIPGRSQTTDPTPWTAFHVDKERFVTQSRGKEQARGLLTLAGSNDQYVEGKGGIFDLYQADPDGASLKTINFTLTAQGLISKYVSEALPAGKVTYTTGDTQPVAALRSGGLGAAYHGRAMQVARDAANASQMNDDIAGETTQMSHLYAQDVLRGYRVDVAVVPDIVSAPETWRTLCAREGKYRWVKNGEQIPLQPDEGYVSGASTTSDAPDSKEHYLHESLFRWTGWSLCVPRSGLAIQSGGDKDEDEKSGDVSHLQTETPSKITNQAEDGCGVVASFIAQKGTLPRLRFGQLYRFRARIVDLAGNSLDVNDTTLGALEQASDAVGYWRFEPVDPPTIVHRTRVSEGESLERMVIRSNYDATTDEYINNSDDFKHAIALPESADFRYHAVNERHFVPPKSSQLQCETHGLFDPYFGDWKKADNWKKVKKGYEIAAREAGTLNEALPGAEADIEFITPTILEGIATTTEDAPKLPSKDNPTGDRMVGGQYVIHAEAQITTPWLPDDASIGVAIRAAKGYILPGVTAAKTLGAPGMPSSCHIVEMPLPPLKALLRKMSEAIPPIIRPTLLKKAEAAEPPLKELWQILGGTVPPPEFLIQVRHGKSWPDSQGFRLILAERHAKACPPFEEQFADAGEPIWDEDNRTLTLFLSKGQVARLRYASALNPAHYSSFGIPHWAESEVAKNSDIFPILDQLITDAPSLLAVTLQQRLASVKGEFVRQYVRDTSEAGVNWMLTPFRDLTLVHATQAPVWEPEFRHLGITRELGSHDAKLITRQLYLHGPSTGKIEIEADWYEWVDDLGQPRPERRHFTGNLSEIRLAENYKGNLSELGEFACYLESMVDAQFPGEVDRKNSKAQRGDVHALGDTRFRLIKYRMRATTRFREYLPPSIYDDKEKEKERLTRLGPVAPGDRMILPPEDDMGAPVLRDSSGAIDSKQSVVPASAPPNDPRVLYVVPTFRWQPNQKATGHDTTRYGNGLRVWLDRPWFSSGDGELLGVVIHKDGGKFAEVPEDLQMLVTQWGVDPFWKSTFLPTAQSKVTDFPAQVCSDEVWLQEKIDPAEPFSGPRVQVVGHRVHWDDTRGLWYCDIELNPGSAYMPFVRLALVRYQPNAINGAEISKVVLTDFAQVLPRRRSVVQVKGDQVTAGLHGPNPDYGPMKFTVKKGLTPSFIGDSAYQSASMSPVVGDNPQSITGRNRVELVLQTRDPAIDSDLAWEDTQILANHIVGESATTKNVADPVLRDVVGKVNLASSPSVTQVPIIQSRQVELRAGGTVNLKPAVDLSKTSSVGGSIAVRDRDRVRDLDPVFWSAAVTLPAVTNDRPRRLMLREFERFYSDDAIEEGKLHRRMVEERLVFADIIPLQVT